MKKILVFLLEAVLYVGIGLAIFAGLLWVVSKASPHVTKTNCCEGH